MKATGVLVLCPPLLAVIAVPAPSNAAWIGPSPTKTKLPESCVSTREGPALPCRRLAARGNPMRPSGGGASTPLTASLTTSPLVTAIVPKIGILTSTFLYFSPMAAVRAAVHAAARGDSAGLGTFTINPVPLAFMAVSSICWLVYGLSIRDPYVTLSNVPGSIASLWYVVAILPLLGGSQLRTTQHVLVSLAAITINLWTYLSLSRRSMEQVRVALGLFASGLFVLLSGSPLSTIKTVLATRNSGSILSSLTIAQVTNTALWSAYGLAIQDKFVYGPILTGLGFGLVQLVLKLAFPSK